MTTATPQKKRRLSNLFGRKTEAPVSPVNANASNEHQPSVSTGKTNTGDSAYASSDNPSSKRNSRADNQYIPVENNGRYDGVSQDRNLAMNKNTGDIVDDDTGEQVTTVTTTTTTTTTTTAKGGKKGTKVEVATQRDGQPVLAEAPGDGPGQRSPPQQQTQPAPLNTTRSRSPQPTHPAALTPGAGPGPVERTPTPPMRNPNRKSREYEPVSPMRPNFSYPSRSELRTSEEPMPPPPVQQPHMQANGGGPAPAPKSTFDNLKAAAVGLHGVGETLRGSLNHEIDSRFPRSNADKAAAANAKNQAVLNNGNRELARLSERTNEDSSYGAPASTYGPPGPQTPGLPGADHPMAPGPGGVPGGNYLPPQAQQEPRYNYSQSDMGTSGSSEMSQVPPSFSPESQQPPKKQGGLRKLIKRRPVEGT